MNVSKEKTASDWSLISEALSAALDQEPSERGKYLDRAFAHDALLRDQVVRLLRCAEEAEDDCFLDVPAWVADDVPLFLPELRNGVSEYSNIEYIGHGGMGVVYKAYHRNVDRWVALKLSSPVRSMTQSDYERFRVEAQSMGRLKHPNIIAVHETGEFEGRPYFVMDLIEGAALHDRLPEYVERPRDAARLLQAVAEAIHYAHQRQILHNDLKPSNILLDEEGKPHVSDFGLARRIGQDAARGAVLGTASYMSPEQAAGDELTTASDVYGLGAVLYALLTGVAPFRGQDAKATLRQVIEEPPVAPRLVNPAVDRTLEAICLKCLAKDKSQRYASANGVAQDLARYQTGKETRALRWTSRQRFIGWCRRHTVEASLGAAVIAIWIFAVVMAVSVAQARKANLREAALHSASFAARDLATTALLQLRSLSKTAEFATSDARLADLLSRRDGNALQQYLHRICGGPPSPFATCFITNAQGVIVGRTRPAQAPNDDLASESYAWRDYFRSARELQTGSVSESVHISRVYRGHSDDLYKFAISAPIRSRDGTFLGVIATSVTTDATMDLVYLHDKSREVVLLAPKDADSAETFAKGTSNQYVVLFHPAYRHGVAAVGFPDLNAIKPLTERVGERQLEIRDTSVVTPNDNYYDPVSSVAKDYQGRWIAGFSPVGNTGFIVVVQQRYAEAVSLESSTYRKLALWSALVSCLAVGILATAIWRSARAVGPDSL